ncbi:MAG: DMT family transporter [Longimicrobiales bacterium]
MTPLALGLVLGAGLVHASWNLILKKSDDRLLVGAWSLVVGGLLFLPVLLSNLPVPSEVWPYVGSSALVFVLYYWALAAAYGQGDFSLVYPVARGTAPALIALWAFLFLGESPSIQGISGIAVILGGLVVLGGAPFWAHRARWRDHTGGLGLAFLIALLISTYSVIDGAGVRLWLPVPYVILTFLLSGFILIPLLGARDQKKTFQVLRNEWWRVGAIAVLTLLAYSMVLRAYQLAPIGYAGAAREIGIVFAALAGWALLGERFGRVRTLGAVLVFIGIGILALAD